MYLGSSFIWRWGKCDDPISNIHIKCWTPSPSPPRPSCQVLSLCSSFSFNLCVVWSQSHESVCVIVSSCCFHLNKISPESHHDFSFLVCHAIGIHLRQLCWCYMWDVSQSRQCPYNSVSPAKMLCACGCVCVFMHAYTHGCMDAYMYE